MLGVERGLENTVSSRGVANRNKTCLEQNMRSKVKVRRRAASANRSRRHKYGCMSKGLYRSSYYERLPEFTLTLYRERVRARTAPWDFLCGAGCCSVCFLM